jgi:hypothetical protein
MTRQGIAFRVKTKHMRYPLTGRILFPTGY